MTFDTHGCFVELFWRSLPECVKNAKHSLCFGATAKLASIKEERLFRLLLHGNSDEVLRKNEGVLAILDELVGECLIEE